MNRKWVFSLGIVALPFLVFAAAREIKINRFSLKPGEVLRFELPRKFHVPPSVTWRNTTQPFRPTWDKAWRAMIPIPFDIPAGSENFYIDPRAPLVRDLYEGPVDIKIEHGSGVSETISVPAEKSVLLANSDEEQESQIIRDFLKASIADEKQMWRGTFLPPVPGVVLSRFGVTRKRTGQDKIQFHRGIDLAARRGAPVVSPADGLVILTKEFNFHGRTVLLSHGQGVCSIYLHLDEIAINEGDRVRRGQVLGRVGSTGFASGPHLHWGVYVEGHPVDPEQWLEEEF